MVGYNDACSSKCATIRKLEHTRKRRTPVYNILALLSGNIRYCSVTSRNKQLPHEFLNSCERN